MLRLKAFSIVLHLAGWALFLMFPLLFMESGQNGEGIKIVFSFAYLSFCLCYISLFYINSYYLIPDLFIPGKYFRYFLSVALLLMATMYLRPFDKLMSIREHRDSPASSTFRRPPPPMEEGQRFSQPIPEKDGQRHSPPPGDMRNGKMFRPGPPPGGGPGRPFRHLDMNSFLIFVLIMAFSMAHRSIIQWQATEKRALLAEADKAIAELSFLKAQINPHFLYNTLNNIYTLSVIGSEKTAESIMKLSNIMRYVTDEAEVNFVPLESELACITDFIDLQKLRLGKMVTLDYTVEGEVASHQISPLLLMTFIENVFKYGLSNHVPAAIVISIRTRPAEIIFHCQNSMFDHKPDKERTGIGIVNTMRRLDHLYAGRYTLNIDQENKLFTVDLLLRS